MALSNRINFRGGQRQPLGNFLYKNGVDNVALTGGLSHTGYSFASTYTERGLAVFNSNDIGLSIPNTAASSITIGSTIKIDFTAINSIIVNYIDSNGNDKVATLNTQALSGERFLAMSLTLTSNLIPRLIIGCVNTKVDYNDYAQSVTVIDASVNTLSLNIKSIQYA